VKLQRPEITQKLLQQLPLDNLDQLVECSKHLIEDVQKIVSFIQGNATLLFKRSTTTAGTPSTPTLNKNGEWLEDYEYVSFEKDRIKKTSPQNEEIEIPKNLEPLDPNDKSVLVYYATQTVTHMNNLTQAIDAFLQTVERNQPPKFFLAYGKFVVLSAHNLVNIGDIVHRNISRENIKTRILACADALSEGLKTCVAKTKKAAQNFPNVLAVQEMVDSIVDISHLACDLKIAMLHSVQQ
jgi:enhancer-of-filamentation protein 1